MRFTSISIAAALVIGASATSVFAQQTPTFDSCFSLSEQRGAGAESGRRNHNAFMRDCLAGNIPVTVGGPCSPQHRPQTLKAITGVRRFLNKAGQAPTSDVEPIVSS